MLEELEKETLEKIAADAQSYADVFALPLSDHYWRGNVGEFAGSGVGSSLDFQDHRAYQPGDDPRHINWQAYARTGNYSMKLYREEVRPLVDIIFDVSDSMFFDPDKQTRALELFYFAQYAAVKGGASVSTFLVKGNRSVPLDSSAVIFHQWLDLAKALPATDSSAAAEFSQLPFRSQSLRIFISDLLFPGDPEMSFRELLQGKGRPSVWCPYSTSESSPQWNGNYEFLDAESQTRHNHRVDRNLLGRYLRAYQRHFDLWKTTALRHRISVARIASDSKFEEAVRREAVPLNAIHM